MTEVCGFVGYMGLGVDPGRRQDLDACRHFSVVQLGCDDGWRDVGIIVFSEKGKRMCFKVDGAVVGRVSLDIWESYVESGWPVEKIRMSLGVFLAKAASQIETTDDVIAILDHPIHLPFDGERRIRFTPPASARSVRDVRDEWKVLLGE